MILQITEAQGLFSEVAQLGTVFGLLVAIAMVEAWLVVKLYKEGKEKSKYHALGMGLKDDIIKDKDKKIEDLSEARRQDSIESINFVRDLQKDIQNLTATFEKLL